MWTSFTSNKSNRKNKSMCSYCILYSDLQINVLFIKLLSTIVRVRLSFLLILQLWFYGGDLSYFVDNYLDKALSKHFFLSLSHLDKLNIKHTYMVTQYTWFASCSRYILQGQGLYDYLIIVYLVISFMEQRNLLNPKYFLNRLKRKEGRIFSA